MNKSIAVFVFLIVILSSVVVIYTSDNNNHVVVTTTPLPHFNVSKNNTVVDRNKNFTSIENISDNKLQIYYNLSASNKNNTASPDINVMHCSTVYFNYYFNNTFNNIKNATNNLKNVGNLILFVNLYIKMPKPNVKLL